MKVTKHKDLGLKHLYTKVDSVSREAVNVTKNLKISGFDQESAWQKISNSLRIDKRFVIWGVSMVASMSLLVAANQVWTSRTLPNNIEQVSPQISDIFPPEKVSNVYEIPNIKLNKLYAKQLKKQPVAQPKPILVVGNLTKKNIHVDSKQDIKASKVTPISFLNHPLISPYFKLNVSTNNRYTPEIGVNFKLLTHYTAKRKETLHLGIFAEVAKEKITEVNNQVTTSTFVSLLYQNTKKNTPRGWAVRSSIMLNTNSIMYQDTTVKIAFFKNIKRKLKIGSEIIFTADFNTITPTLSVVFG